MKIGRVLAATTALAVLICGSAGAAEWRVPGRFPTLQAAIDSSLVKDGDVLRVLPGRRTGATVTKAVVLRALGCVTIVDGPAVNDLGKAGFLFPGGGAGSGATVDGFTFEGVAFPVFSRGADDVSVTRNTMHGPLQGVSNWANGAWGKGWDITHNTILDLRTSCAGGIGILIGDYKGGAVTGNVIAHNEVRGRVRVPSDDCGGYDAPGIVLFADWRYSGDTGATITRNRVTKNRVSISSGKPALVAVAGVELSDTRNDPTELDITDNAVVYNDLRGTGGAGGPHARRALDRQPHREEPHRPREPLAGPRHRRARARGGPGVPVPLTTMSCPHCDSADVRPSRHTLGLDRIGLHRYRCRACGGLFWLRRGRIEAVRARRRDYLEAPAGTARPRTAPLPVTLGRLDPAPDALGALDPPPDTPAPVPDLRALDLELAGSRRETPPR